MKLKISSASPNAVFAQITLDGQPVICESATIILKAGQPIEAILKIPPEEFEFEGELRGECVRFEGELVSEGEERRGATEIP